MRHWHECNLRSIMNANLGLHLCWSAVDACFEHCDAQINSSPICAFPRERLSDHIAAADVSFQVVQGQRSSG